MDVHGVVCSSLPLSAQTPTTTQPLGFNTFVVEHPNAVLLDECSMTQQGQHPTTQLFVCGWWLRAAHS